MKKLILFGLLSSAVLFAAAQSPVSWTFTAKKIAEKKYEVHLTATVQQGWHLYSQTQPKDAVVNPTSFTFSANPLIATEGKVKETGKMEKFHDEKLGVSANQYANNVDFVQVVNLKAKAKTNLAGVVEFQTCDDKKCLPPKKVTFSVPIM
ncbi:MAG: protein-disulfide reductase DsbD family protein [Chitinophagaceae bacterium]